MSIDISHFLRSCDIISHERLHKYKQLIPYEWVSLVLLPYYGMQFNAALFYPTLQVLEVCLRNRIYSALASFYAKRAKTITLSGAPEEWYLWMPENQKTRLSIKSAISSARHDIKKRGIIPGDIICRLTFGDWVSILDEHPHTTDPLFFWNYVYKDIFPNTTKSKKGTILSEIKWAKSIRNRLSHHEPLWTSSDICTLTEAKNTLIAKHTRLLEIIRWISDDVFYSYASEKGFHYEKYFRLLMEQGFEAYNLFLEHQHAQEDTAL